MKFRSEITKDEFDEFFHSQIILTLDNESRFYNEFLNYTNISSPSVTEMKRRSDVWARKLRDEYDIPYTYETLARVFIHYWDKKGFSASSEEARKSIQTYRDNIVKSDARHFPNQSKPKDNSVNQPIQENTMSAIEKTVIIDNSSPVVTVSKTFIYGKEAEKMTADELIAAIRTTENSLASLEAIKTKSKTIEQRKQALNADLNKLVEILDTKE